MTQTYAALSRTRGAAAADALGEALETLEPVGVGVFEIEDGSGDWEVSAYFDAAPDAVALALLAAAQDAAPFAVSRIDQTDWVAQVRRELSPVRAGRFALHGRHDRARIPPNAIAIEIEAAMAFGTGHHGTTLGCLLAIDRLAKAGFRPRRVADIGCGTGVLAIAAARRWKSRAEAGDLDPVAVATARANAAHAGAQPWVQVSQGAGTRTARIRAGAPYDLVLANILARPLKRLRPELMAVAAPGGVIVLSGFLTRQAADVSAAYRACGCRSLFTLLRRDWVTAVLQTPGRRSRRRPARPR